MMRAGAALDLDRKMRKTGQSGQLVLVEARRSRMIGHDRDDRGEMTGADTPEMKVGDAVAGLFEPRRDFSR